MTTFLAWRHRTAVKSIAALTAAGPSRVSARRDGCHSSATCSGCSAWTRSPFANPGCLRLLLSDVRRHCSNRFPLFRLASSARPPILGRILASI